MRNPLARMMLCFLIGLGAAGLALYFDSPLVSVAIGVVSYCVVRQLAQWGGGK